MLPEELGDDFVGRFLVLNAFYSKSLWVASLVVTLAACGNQATMNGGGGTERRNMRTADGLSAPSADAIGIQVRGSNALPPGGESTEGDTEPPDLPAPTMPPGQMPDDGDMSDGGMSDGGAPDDGMPDDNTGRPPTTPPDGRPNDGERPKIVRESVNPSHLSTTGYVDHELASSELSQDLTLRAELVERSLQVTQAARPTAIDEHTQGQGAQDVTEEFDGQSNRILDVLLVLDNGSSMREEARHMAAKIAPLIGLIDATDWQIGVVTTDPSQTCLRALVKKGDTNAAQLLANAVSVGTYGSNNPRGVLQAVRSLKGDCLQKPWIRAASSVEVMIVSDQDNCGNGRLCNFQSYANGSYLKNYLATIRTVGQNAHVHGVFMPPGVEACDCPTARYEGRIYGKLVSDTGGAWGSICEENYTPALNAITSNVEQAMRTAFTLAKEPLPGTLRVYVDGAEITTGFTVAGNVITLATPLGNGRKLRAVYRDQAPQSQVRFALRFAPLAGSEQVQVNGVTLPSSAYTIDAADPAIVFAAPPAAAARISITYTRDVPLATRFPLGSAVSMPDTLAVAVDGAPVNGFTLDAASGYVTLAAAPRENAVIVFTWKAPGAPILRYPVDIPAESIADLKAYVAGTNVAFPISYDMGFVAVAPQDFVAGKRLVLRYLNPSRDDFTVILSNDPIPGYVAASAGSVICQAAPQLVVVGREVSLSGCPFPADATSVRISYSYLVPLSQITFNEPGLPGPNDYQVWTVFIGNVETKDYTRVGNVFTINNLPPYLTQVRIRLEQYAP